MSSNMQKLLIVACVVGMFFVVCGCIFTSLYNAPMNSKIDVQQNIGNVAVYLQRQADVVLNAQAGFSTIAGLDNAQIMGFVAEAKALSGEVGKYCDKSTGMCNLPEDPEAQQKMLNSMSAFDTSSTNFIAYVQQHPALRTADAFDTFMISVEGSANRVSTYREILQASISAYKRQCLNFPGTIFCGMRGMTGNEFQYFKDDTESPSMPRPNFPTPVMPMSKGSMSGN